MLQGFLDRADLSGISGWARDTEEVSRRVELEVFDGETLLTRVVADRLRPDLLRAEIGDGCYGFWVQFPEGLLPCAVHQISVRFKDGHAHVAKSPKLVYRQDGGLDPSFTDWFDRHINNAAIAASETSQLAPLFALCANALGRILHADALLNEARTSVLASEIERVALPARLKAALEQAFQTCAPVRVPAVPDPQLSIIIAGGGSLRDNYDCLRSILASRSLRSFEIVFVDVTGTAEMALFPFLATGGVRFVKTPEPAPILDAYRIGLSAARGRRLLFLGHVTAVEPDAISALSATLDRFDGRAIVMPRLVGADGRIIEVGSRFGPLATRIPIGALEPAHARHYRILRQSADVSTRAFMVDRDLLDEVNGFSGIDQFGDLGMADVAFRLRAVGAAVLAQGFAGMTLSYHAGSSGADRSGRRRFVDRWQGVLPAAQSEGQGVRPKRALVVDERFPDPTRDAASVAILSHCESLVRLGYSVEFASAEADMAAPDGGASLLTRGIVAHPNNSEAAEVLQARPGQFDVVYLHRLSVAKRLTETCRATQPEAQIVFSIADLLSLRLRRQAELDNDERALADSARIEQEEQHFLRAVDGVITHSTEEEAWIRETLPTVRVARVLWTHKLRAGAARAEGRKNFCFLGHFGHEPNGDAVRHFLQSLWPNIRQELPAAQFELIGSKLELGGFDQSPPGVVARGYIADVESYLAGVRVMVAPLRFGAGVKGKVLLSFAEGLPCVMTAIAAEGLALPGEISDLMVADNVDAFVRKAIAIYTNDGVWSRASELVREWAAAHLQTSAIDRDLAALLQDPTKFAAVAV